MKPEPAKDPVVALMEAMLDGKATPEQIREAKRAAVHAEFAHLSDEELMAMAGPSTGWAAKLTDDELDDAIDLLSSNATIDELLAFLSTCKALTPADLEEFRRDHLLEA